MEERLQGLGERYEAARQAFEAAQRDLHAAVREARPSDGSGLTLRRIAELTGLSFGRVHQLTKE